MISFWRRTGSNSENEELCFHVTPVKFGLCEGSWGGSLLMQSLIIILPVCIQGASLALLMVRANRGAQCCPQVALLYYAGQLPTQGGEQKGNGSCCV